MATGTIPKNKVNEIELMGTNTDVSAATSANPIQINLSVPYDAFSFLVVRFASGSADSSSSRGSLIIPYVMMGAGGFYPVYLGSTVGYVRLGGGDTTSKLKILDKSFSTLYVRAVYGIF